MLEKLMPLWTHQLNRVIVAYVVGYYKALALAMLVKKIWIIYLLSPYLPRSDFDTISAKSVASYVTSPVCPESPDLYYLLFKH